MVTASGVHVGTVVEVTAELLSVVTLRGTFWFEHELVDEVSREVVRLRCEFGQLELYAQPEPGQDGENGMGAIKG